MVEEQRKVNGDAEVDVIVERTGKTCNGNGGSIVIGDRHDYVDGSYVFVDNGDGNNDNDRQGSVVEYGHEAPSDVVLGGGGGEMGEVGDPVVEVSAGIDGEREIICEGVMDDSDELVNVGASASVREAGECFAELPPIKNTERFDGTETLSDAVNGGLKIEKQSSSDLHHDPEGEESVDKGDREIVSFPESEEFNVYSFDCCCVPVGGGLRNSSISADESTRETVDYKGQDLTFSFDCCNVPVRSCESGNVSSAGENTVESVFRPAASTSIEVSEGTRVDDDGAVAESKTLDLRNIGGDINNVTITDHVDGVPNSLGAEISQDVLDGDKSQHIPVDDIKAGSVLINSPEMESCGESTTEIIVEGKSAPNADTAYKSFDVSEDINGDTVPAGNPPTHINDTTVQAGVVEESAKIERSVASGDMRSESKVGEAIDSSVDASGNETVVSASDAVEAVADQVVCLDNDDTSNCQEPEEVNKSQEDGAEVPVAEVVIQPFYFLARHPRFEDTNLREQLQLAQLEVDEKTKERDAIRMEIQDMRSTRQGFNDEVGAAISKGRGLRDLLKSKRQEIDSVQSMMNRVKNAISVEDIDGRINNLQYMIEHETLPLSEEKQFIREIKQLKQLRAQLSTNVSKDEVQKAMDDKDKIEERLRALKKEADGIRVELSRFEDDRKSSKNKYSDENKRLGDLQAKFKAANDIRQNAYMHLQSLRKQLYEKNKHFRGYKDDINTVENFISTKNKGDLHRYCVNQVESFMDLWNNNAEFSKEYIRCNTRNTLRRLGTIDGRSLGPEEKPALIPPVIMHNSRSAKVKSASQTSSLEHKKQVANVEAEKIDDKPALKVVKPNAQTAKSGKSQKSAPVKSAPAVTRRVEIEEAAELSKPSKEEEEVTRREKELARIEEEQRKEEEAVRLKELRRLEEKVKAKEAMERKKRQAEKSQARAALRAQKEAEERDRERERRAKKKIKKKTTASEATDSVVEGYHSEDVKVPEIKDKPKTMSKNPHKPSLFTKPTKSKSVPLPLRNRGKKRMQSWMWFLIVAVIIFALFLLGNSNLSFLFGLERFGF